MIARDVIERIVSGYDKEKIKIGCLASHSALDVADGACEEGFVSRLFCQKGREKTYAIYFKSRDVISGKKGFVDEVVIYDKFAEMTSGEEQEKMRYGNIIFVPNRAFSSYIPIHFIEEEFTVPLFGTRGMLGLEERGEERDYYWFLDEARLPHPQAVKPEKIERLAIVKLHHARKRLERGFFTAASFEEFKQKSSILIEDNIITKDDLKNARIEEYIVGPVFNLDFFYSPLDCEVELLGIDWRFESSLDGHVRLPAPQQMTLPETQKIPEMTVCGHSISTLRESLLEEAFVLAEKFVETSKRLFPPGIIGPFCLQTCVDKDLKFFIYDVAPRLGGGTNVHVAWGHPYGNSLWRKPMSSGRRIALEIRRAIENNRIEEIVT
jgi:5-formaminoimidazole-4-carboxamide-1-(beta)-D-ribofuranosyl 5'-monophosphate synthetase